MTTHEAGRELDALIAEKVFGGPEKNAQWYWWSGSTPSLPIDPPLYAGPQFSTDIAAAWAVVEKLRDTTDGDETWVSVMDYGARGWCCEIVYNLCSGKDAPVVLGEIVADTAPLAICLAALDAVRTEVSA